MKMKRMLMKRGMAVAKTMTIPDAHSLRFRPYAPA